MIANFGFTDPGQLCQYLSFKNVNLLLKISILETWSIPDVLSQQRDQVNLIRWLIYVHVYIHNTDSMYPKVVHIIQNPEFELGASELGASEFELGASEFELGAS